MNATHEIGNHKTHPDWLGLIFQLPIPVLLDNSFSFLLFLSWQYVKVTNQWVNLQQLDNYTFTSMKILDSAHMQNNQNVTSVFSSWPSFLASSVSSSTST